MNSPVYFNDGRLRRNCRAAVTARFERNRLTFAAAPGICSDGHQFSASFLDCTPSDDGVAACSGRIASSRYHVNLHHSDNER